MRETRNAMLVKAALISTILLCPISSGRTCCEEIDWETVVKVARALSIADSPPRPSASDALESRAREVLSRLQHPHPQVWITVHHARPDDGRHVAHAAPRMGGRTLQPQVVPGVQSPRRVGRGHGEGMQQYGEIVLGGGSPYGLQVRMV